MENLKYTTGDFEVVDSRILNVLENFFEIQFHDITFHFEFGDIKDLKKCQLATDKEPKNGKYNIIIGNFNNPELMGFFEPMLLGTVDGIQYYFSLSGWAIPGKVYDVIIINILRKI